MFLLFLNMYSYEDNYQGDFTTRRALIYTLSILLQSFIFMALLLLVRLLRLFKLINIQILQIITKREQRYTVTPNPATADADDDFGFNETTSFFQDAKQRDVTSGSDE